ncbi:MAG: serine protein kinase PrkA [Myxococcales bacterium]|nr:serine protein kinase PrkA [Myxococcales bacterium]
MFQHYGTVAVTRPWGEERRFRLFDRPWERTEDCSLEPKLVANEALQNALYRSLCNFAREGRASRLLLMHGPNGSAKSTVAACVLAALEDYSQLEEGALYRFHWIFPTKKKHKGAIGFGSKKALGDLESYAHLDEEDIDARLVIELRDHPLFLIPRKERRTLLAELWGRLGGPNASPPEWLLSGELCHKNKLIFEALLAASGGNIGDVLRHVQVERYFMSRRYRLGAITLGPEMSVDASERQITADRSLGALPTSLQATTLFEAHGELVEAAGGVLEFSDLLKRPLDAYRYLQLSLETGQVALPQQTVTTNVVMLGSANDVHLAAFREHPEYASFRGRIELVAVPYLRNAIDEERIYTEQVLPMLRRHVAPYTARVAAEFAVLTRLHRPDPARYEKALGEVVRGLSVVEKMVLYAQGEPPRRLDNDKKKLLRASCRKLYLESEADLSYEGSIGASPRTMRVLLLDAAQSPDYACVSPFAVLKSLDELCRRAVEFEWLQRKATDGGYGDHKVAREQVRLRLADAIEGDMRSGSGLVEAQQYGELFRRYVHQVSAYARKEKLRNTVTGKDEPPDEKMMREVETLLGVDSAAKDHRDTLLSHVAAWAIDHPGQEPRHEEIFADYVERIQAAAFARLRQPLANRMRDLVTLLRHAGAGLESAPKRVAASMLTRLAPLGYEADSAADAASWLLRERYADIVV